MLRAFQLGGVEGVVEGGQIGRGDQPVIALLGDRGCGHAIDAHIRSFRNVGDNSGDAFGAVGVHAGRCMQAIEGKPDILRAGGVRGGRTRRVGDGAHGDVVIPDPEVGGAVGVHRIGAHLHGDVRIVVGLRGQGEGVQGGLHVGLRAAGNGIGIAANRHARAALSRINRGQSGGHGERNGGDGFRAIGVIERDGDVLAELDGGILVRRRRSGNPGPVGFSIHSDFEVESVECPIVVFAFSCGGFQHHVVFAMLIERRAEGNACVDFGLGEGPHAATLIMAHIGSAMPEARSMRHITDVVGEGFGAIGIHQGAAKAFEGDVGVLLAGEYACADIHGGLVGHRHHVHRHLDACRGRGHGDVAGFRWVDLFADGGGFQVEVIAGVGRRRDRQ